jgi:type VI secretion system secreted protein VgrG
LLHEILHHGAELLFLPEVDRDSLFHACLRPQLAYLAHRYNQRIFQHLTVPQIISQVLEDHGIQSDAYQFQLGYIYPERDYCVQYDESDLHFIQRLCEEEGISFHFQHSEDSHRLVFGDDASVFPKLDPLNYQQGSGLAADHEVVRAFGVRTAEPCTKADLASVEPERRPATKPATQKTRRPTL